MVFFFFLFNLSPIFELIQKRRCQLNVQLRRQTWEAQLWPEVSTSSALRFTHRILPLARAWRSQNRKACQAKVCCQDKDGNTSADLLVVSIVTQLEEQTGRAPSANPKSQPAPFKSHFLLLLLKEDHHTVLVSTLAVCEVQEAAHRCITNRQDINPGLKSGLTY